jgi:hypothetical protein
MKRIVLIACYFGNLPQYVDFYLKSAEANSTVDFLLVTDDKTNRYYPQNVKVKYMAFDELKEKMQNLFDFKISLPTPYKLCDYKPVYGHLFYDIVKQYDYWGYADIDLIFGNIRSFITEEVLNEGYDKIQTAGHFTIMPTTDENIFFYQKNIEGQLFYKDVYSSENNFAFDEWPGVSTFYKTLGEKVYNQVNDIADLSYKVKHFLPSEEGYSRIGCKRKDWNT